MASIDAADIDVLYSNGSNQHPLMSLNLLTRRGSRQLLSLPTGRRLLQVLVIDDDHGLTDQLSILIQRWGHVARIAYNGATGMQSVSEQPPDVVMLDMDMSVMDGCEVAQRLRINPQSAECLLIALTRRANVERRKQCLAAGIDLVLLKPVDPGVIETLLTLECNRVHWHDRRAASGARPKAFRLSPQPLRKVEPGQ